MQKLFISFILFCFSYSDASASNSISVVEGLDYRSNKTVSVEIEKSKRATVVVFLSAHCPCSKGHQQTLTAIAKEFEPLGFQFLGVHSNANEHTDESQSYFSKQALPFPVLKDSQTKLADQLGALKTPHVFIISKSGEVLFSGGVDDSKTGLNPKTNYLKTALNQVLEGKKVDPNVVRTLGCTIARP